MRNRKPTMVEKTAMLRNEIDLRKIFIAQSKDPVRIAEHTAYIKHAEEQIRNKRVG